MGILIEACATIIRETGAAVMLVHHTGKNGVGERGSSALFAACDSVIALANDDGLITLACAKSKDGKPFVDRYLRLIEVATGEGRGSCVALPSDRVITQGAPLSAMKKKVLETLALETFIEVGAKWAMLQRATGIADASLFRALSALMREGYIRQAAKGDPYYIEQKGILALGVLSPLPKHFHESYESSTNSLPSLPPPFRVEVEGSSGGRTKDSSVVAEQPHTLPYLDAITKPLHNGNGRHG